MFHMRAVYGLRGTMLHFRLCFTPRFFSASSPLPSLAFKVQTVREVSSGRLCSSFSAKQVSVG